ncbi:BamA/TamA family outer membrane protein [Marivirga sp. S37H4]|uniref:BamA/TamA family outer membrane protein n=1 Tax=Marivirga aurantiaca TaxID=2802615 RepID=A0A934WXJ5_9BACT|nr:BamA/TamA family outer membrane protein [Marivirga aurantiaca]
MLELRKLVKLDENKIFNTGLFNSVQGEIAFIESGGNDVEVKFFIEERWYIWPSIIFNLADRNFSDWLFNQDAATDRFEYGFRFDQFNVRGLNEKLRVMAQFGFKRRFTMGYRIPYINKKQKLGIGFNSSYSEFDQIDIKNIKDKREFIDADSLFGDNSGRNLLSTRFYTSLDFTYRENFYNAHAVALSYNQISVADTIAILNPDYLGNGKSVQRSLNLRYNFRRDFRDRNNYPLKGFLIDVTVEKNGLGIFNDINQGSLNLKVSRYKPLKHNFNIASSITAYTSFPQNQPYTTLNGLGFANELLKGYELYVIQGQHYIMHKSELKKRLFSIEANLGKLMPLKQFRKVPIAGYVKIYFDQGYVENNLDISTGSILSNRYLYSYGVGVDLVTYYDAVLRLEYSVNALNEAGFFINVKAGI